MKLQPDRIVGVNVIGGYTSDSVRIGERTWHHSLLLPWQGEATAWRPANVDELGVADFEAVAKLKPELVLFGSGHALRFAHPALLRPLIERRIGVETMDTAAACRTYNLLVAEGRSVVAALLLAPIQGVRKTPPAPL